MSQEKKIEAGLRAKYESGEFDTGLYRAGSKFVVMDNYDGEICFQWFDEAIDVSDMLAAGAQ